MSIGLLAASLFAAALAHSDAASPAVAEAAAKLEELTAKAPPSIRIEFRAAAAKAWLRYSPDLAHKFAGQLAAQIMDTRTKERFLLMLKRAGLE